MSKPRGAGNNGLAKTTTSQSLAGANIRGATALTKKSSSSGARPAAPSKQDRKNSAKANRAAKQADEAMRNRRYDVAEGHYERAISLLDTPPPRLWVARFMAAAKAANHEYVVDNYKRIRAMASSEDELSLVDQVWIDCLIAAGYYHDALESAEILSAQTRRWSSFKSITGVIQGKLGNLDKAIAIQKLILEKEPSHATARWHLALHQLEAGELPEAFDNYEARWGCPDFPSERRTFDMPRWNGENVEGKRILVWREQGVGDEIRFAGVLPDLIAAGARITLECNPKLAGLFRMSFPDIEVRPLPPADKRKSKNYRDFDFEVPLGSLARFFRPTVKEMQAKCRPWLKRDAKIENEVRESMNVAPQQPVIGLCWRSSNRNLHRDWNYIKAEYLAALKLLGRSRFICLQYDECLDEVKLMQELGLPITFFPEIDQMNDLVSASHLAGACDLVVSAGTASAELSAGLGVPTVLFGQKQTQIQLGTDIVPWHPATRHLPLDPDDPMAIAKQILFNWQDIAGWAEKMSISGREIDWQLSLPASA